MHSNWFRILILWGFLLLSACGGSSESQTSNNSTPQVNSNQMGGAIQTNLPSLSRSVSTFAGSSTGSIDENGTAAKFNQPYGITTDGTNLYVADHINNTIRKVVIATGAVTTIAGTAGSSGSTDGTGISARFGNLNAITTDGINLYVTDTGTIRKINIASGVVTTLAGSPTGSGRVDGTGTSARFVSGLYGITTDGTNLFVVENSSFTIRKIVIASGVVTTLAGTVGSGGYLDGIGTSAKFIFPSGITTDGTNLFVSDQETIRKVVIATGAVTTLAGSAGSMGAIDGIGSAARFRGLSGITMDGTNLYVADSGNCTIRKVVIATGSVTTLAGTPLVLGALDGIGPAASFNDPYGVTTDGTSVFATDIVNTRIRRIN